MKQAIEPSVDEFLHTHKLASRAEGEVCVS